ncbi:Pleckstrin homology-like domain [Plasmopara halstedii]|uniref:Pleckstrin homology-like domain n=1 Tax=Plasmopara halstedii TaxID=4781 RepID=A0A0N7L4I0_PLAHL|nr:Pleckstrin homology-like domain [Plasmopara halstedii]CEG38731.1 Pleckstrin homology-like domain [Plasmopara halstedii]|eukprot:XP_024575100.1 Pleckstrin homology-like domain [Plasmopara halstedii]
MKAIAHRLRGRRTGRRDEGLANETGFRFEEAVQYGDTRKPNQQRAGGDHLTLSHEHQKDNRRMNGHLHCKDGDSIYNASTSSLESSQLHQPITRTHSESQGDEASALRSHSAPSGNPAIRRSVSSTNSHSSSAGRCTTSRYGDCAPFVATNALKVDETVEFGHSGYLMTKSDLDGVDKYFYFTLRHHPKLYKCENETSFKLWLKSGHTLDDRSENASTKTIGPDPVLMGTILRANIMFEEDEDDKRFSVIIGSASRCITLDFIVEDGGSATQWVDALQEIQITKQHSSEHPCMLGSALDKRMLLSLDEHDALRRADSMSSFTESISEYRDVAGKNIAHEDRESLAPKVTSLSDARMSYVPSGKTRSDSLTDEAISVLTPTSNIGVSPTSTSTTSEDIDRLLVSRGRAGSNCSSHSLYASRAHRMDSVASNSSTTSIQSQRNIAGNVLLFVPVAGSSLTVSASKLAKAKQELDALVANGARLPSRLMHGTVSGETIEWRYGYPEYVLTDLAYAKGCLRRSETASLAAYVEEGCQTFVMEATHKSRYDQWNSVDQASFYLQINDGLQVPGSSILENDMFGLLYLGDAVPCTDTACEECEEHQDPRVVLTEAFPDGFPMEVLDVFTQPPQCYFSWRHWGPFTGKYKGIKGDGRKVEMRGFGEMTFKTSRIESLRLFYNQKDTFNGLQHAIDRVVRTRRDTATAFDYNLSYGRKVRSTSTISAPVRRKGSAPNPKTCEIVEELANFTIEAKKQHRKQTQ